MRPVRLAPTILAAVGLAATLAGPASATQVADVDDGQVWVSTLDGAQKRSLSGPSPDEKQWTEVTQGNDGSILGVRRESGKIGTLNATRLWGPTGTQVAGAVTFRLKTAKAYRKRLSSLPRKTLTIIVTSGGRAATVRRTLR